MDYSILDFSNWQDGDFFERQFNKLIEGLHIFYQDKEARHVTLARRTWAGQ